MPKLDTRDAEPDRRALYDILRNEWKAQGEGRTFTQLAKELDVPKQKVSQWATGSSSNSDSQPPWWVLMHLCRELGMAIVVSPDGAQIRRRK